VVPVCLCEHGRERSKCKQRVRPRRPLQAPTGGSAATDCKDCGGSGICEHGRWRSECKECGGSGICEHGRHRGGNCGAGGCGGQVRAQIPSCLPTFLPAYQPACSPPIFDLPPPVLLPTLEIPLT
jgi:hypothetical protein